jgi:hypothetical protein
MSDDRPSVIPRRWLGAVAGCVGAGLVAYAVYLAWPSGGAEVPTGGRVGSPETSRRRDSPAQGPTTSSDARWTARSAPARTGGHPIALLRPQESDEGWPADVPASYRRDALEHVVHDAVEKTHLVEVETTLDCSEYPCIVEIGSWRDKLTNRRIEEFRKELGTLAGCDGLFERGASDLLMRGVATPAGENLVHYEGRVAMLRADDDSPELRESLRARIDEMKTRSARDIDATLKADAEN